MGTDPADQRPFCPVFRPNKQEFSRPPCEYVREVCRRFPDIAMFKVIPPKGWSPQKGKASNLQDIRITNPIKQHVIGTGGAFRCFFEEGKNMSVADFKKLASSRSHQPPPSGHRQDDMLERAFWSSVTVKPPLYGADTPVSLFDEKLDFGWNLHDLQDLLKEYDVPSIPGVTTPMAYFGMWKSFFSWHVEDVDLYSTNYLHFGAPKVWYCVSPKDRPKFEAMAKNMFPELHRICPAFMRHKDILFSPKMLRSYGVDYLQAKQCAGEFVVLNAGAYHSGFNLGFNCAEAVNFATSDWLAKGRVATRCTCQALPDSVRLDMGMFAHGPKGARVVQSLSSSDASDSEGSDAESEPDASSAHSSGSPAPEVPAPASWSQPGKAGTVGQKSKAEEAAAGSKRSRGAAPGTSKSPSAKRQAVQASDVQAQARTQRPPTGKQSAAMPGNKAAAKPQAAPAPTPQQLRRERRERAAAEAQLARDMQRAREASLEPEDELPAAAHPTMHVQASAQAATKEVLSRKSALQHLSAKAEAVQEKQASKALARSSGQSGNARAAAGRAAAPTARAAASQQATTAAAGAGSMHVPPVCHSQTCGIGQSGSAGHSHASATSQQQYRTSTPYSPKPEIKGAADLQSPGAEQAVHAGLPRPRSAHKQQQSKIKSPPKASPRRSPRSLQQAPSTSNGGFKRALNWVTSLGWKAGQANALDAVKQDASQAAPRPGRPSHHIDVDLTLSEGEHGPVAEQHAEAAFPSLQPLRGQSGESSSPPSHAPKGQTHLDLMPEQKPMAIVGEDDHTKRKYFHLVQRLQGHSPGRSGKARVRLLHEGPDSVFRPTGEEFEEAESALIPVRSTLVPGHGNLPGGFDLKTLRSKLLRTELLD